MLKNKKVLALALPVLLLVGYKMTHHAPVKVMKIKGTIYVMPKEFLLNLSNGRYAKVSVALQLAPGQSDGAAAGASASSEGSAGTLPEEPLVREIVTNKITDQNGERLIGEKGRAALKQQILLAITKETDLKVEAVLIPELTVQ